MATFSIAQPILALIWSKQVKDKVTEPYLDEVFHVRQAQHYCEGNFDVWDPKITTPPGVYLLSYAIGRVRDCHLFRLRDLSLACLTAIFAVVVLTYSTRQITKQSLQVARHTSLNITLFPPLFFFCALYYTDVPSTFSVLLFYWLFLDSHRHNVSPWIRTPALTFLGAISLMFRQTNIFWVAVFPAGIVLANELDTGHQVIKDSMHKHAEGFGDSVMSVAKTSWKMEVVFDPSVRDAWIEDYFKTIVSIAASGLKAATKPKRILALIGALAPYIILMAQFGAFIIRNGGVVLGDKSNHIATIHLPQMLYIWPYFTFFSWPLLYPYLAALPMALLAKLPNVAPLEGMLMFKRRHLAPRLWVLALLIAIACAVVYFNTIVHPFTLADNRHYTFYVFRLLMRPAWVRYAVTPIYIACGWACIQVLSARPLSTTQPIPQSDTKPATDPAPSTRKPLSLPDGMNSATVSFVIVWLTTTTLQLVTAPLVEPRYLILPWIFWRMHLPLQQYTPAPNETNKQEAVVPDYRLYLETAWHLVINIVTGYIFLNWEFTWPQEPGKVQRFMW